MKPPRGSRPESVEIVLEESGSGTVIRWTAVPGAESYDVIRGQLAHVVPAPFAIDVGPVVCIENDSPDESTETAEDPDLPNMGAAYFYLVKHQGESEGVYGVASSSLPRLPAAGDCAPAE